MATLGVRYAVGLAIAELCVGTLRQVHADVGQAPSTGVRAIGASVAQLVNEGRDRSPTFRSLVRELDSSPWIVFVQNGSCRLPGVRGCLLHRVGVFDGRRYLRVVLNDPPNVHDDAIATIGHELQHAVEVVTDPRIEDAADISRLYRRIGYLSMRTASGQLYETRRAVRAGAKILEELRTERRTAERIQTTPR